MKKLTIYICSIMCLLLLSGCNKGKVSKNLIIDTGKSSKFSQAEIDDAVKCVKNNFSFRASTLTKICYDEKKSNKIADDYLKYGHGSDNGAKKENIIVLLSNFDVGDTKGDSTFNSNTTYTDYQWTLIRDNKTGKWKIDDAGY